MKKRHFEIIHLTWIDSETVSGWQALTDLTSNFQINHSIGFLLHQDAQMFVLAADYDPENAHFNRVIRIPVACVREVRTLAALPVTA